MDDKNHIKDGLSLCKSSFIAVAVFSMCINMLMIVPAIYMLQVYDRVITSGSYSTLLMLTLILAFLLITMGGLEWVRSRILVINSTKLDALLNQKVFDASFNGALYSKYGVASQALQDLSALRQFLTGNGLFAFFDAPWVPLYIAVMFMFHPLYGWVGVFAAVVLSILALLNEKLTCRPLQKANQEAVVANIGVTKNLQNAEVVASMGMLDSMRSRWLERHNKVLVWQAKASSTAVILTSISKTFRLLVQSLILGIGAYLVINQEITAGLMIAGSILLGRALAPIDQMIGAWKGFVASRAQYKRLKDVLVFLPEDEERMDLPAPQGRIDFESAIVCAPGETSPILQNVSFSTEKGEVVGIIGASASGKSTLVRALLGVWPAVKGSVRLDGADISRWNRATLGPHIGYLPQDIELFDGTVSENIARFGQVDSDAVVKAAQLAGVHEMILALPEGYDTVIGSNGGVLSGGQRQRIGLARALYGNPVLVVLDEPNANLDERGERALAKTISSLKQQRITVFIVTHRAAILSHVDKVMVLADGRLQNYAPREQVMSPVAASTPNKPVQVKKVAQPFQAAKNKALQREGEAK